MLNKPSNCLGDCIVVLKSGKGKGEREEGKRKRKDGRFLRFRT